MKAILRFNLDDSEDRHYYKLANMAHDMASSLNEFKEFMRLTMKREEMSDDAYNMLDKVSEKFFEIMKENNIDINRL